jgi:MFS family permease
MWISAGVIGAAFLLAPTLHYPARPKAIAGNQEEKTKESDRGRGGLIEKNAVLPSVMTFFVAGTWGTLLTFVAIFSMQRAIGGGQFFFAAMASTMLVSRPIFGRMVDRRGYRLSLILGLIFATTGFTLLSCADSLPVLLASAVILGIGFGALFPTLQTMAMAKAPLDRRGAATATYYVGFDGGIGVGSVAYGAIAGLLGYQMMYVVCALIPLAVGVMYFTADARRRVW